MRGKQEGRGSGIEGCRAVWLGELKGMSRFEVMKRDHQERVQETTEQVETAAEVLASTVVESVDGCEDRLEGVEVSVFVSRDRIQRLALEQHAGFSEAVEGSVIKVVPQDSIQQRIFEQSADFQEDSFFLYLSREEFQQREKCVEMLQQLMKVPKTVLQDGVQRLYE